MSALSRYISIWLLISATAYPIFVAAAEECTARLMSSSIPELASTIYHRLAGNPDYMTTNLPELKPDVLSMMNDISKVREAVKLTFSEQSLTFKAANFFKKQKLMERLDELDQQAMIALKSNRINYGWYISFAAAFTEIANLHENSRSKTKLDNLMRGTWTGELETKFMKNFVNESNQVIFLPLYRYLRQEDFNRLLHLPIFLAEVSYGIRHVDGVAFNSGESFNHDIRHAAYMMSSAFRDLFTSAPEVRFGSIVLNNDKYVLNSSEQNRAAMTQKARLQKILIAELASISDPVLKFVVELTLFELFHEEYKTTFNSKSFGELLNFKSEIFAPGTWHYEVIAKEVERHYPEVDAGQYMKLADQFLKSLRSVVAEAK